MQLTDLQRKIADKKATIGVIGLGYVGLPVAALFADAGFAVIGVDIKAERIRLINEGRSPIEGDEPGLADMLARVVASGRLRATTSYEALRQADVVLIDVETPVAADRRPRYEALRAACCMLGHVLRAGALVIVESTIAPGTMNRVVRPLLEESTGWQAGADFYLGACPERVMPGKLLRNLRTMSRVCGGDSPETAETMAMLYGQIVQADLDTADLVTAELVKTTENAYRDVQIAFANEVALICEAVGADVWRVRELVNKVPSRQMHLPGAGVGGHCIPKDPWLLAYGADEKVPVRLIPAARAVNDEMPLHIAKLAEEALSEAGVPMNDARIAVLGYAYLENSDDTRNSPSEALVEALRARGAHVRIHDPWITDYHGDLLDTFRECDAAVFMVAHDAYRDLNFAPLVSAMRTPVIVDGRHLFEPEEIRAAGFIFRGVGQGSER